MTSIPAAPFRLFYVDDSGAVSSGFIVYSWVELAASDWAEGLRGWLDMRKKMFARYQIPPSYELHSAMFAGGHGNPSTNSAWNRQKRNRGEVLQMALGQIGSCGILRVGTLYRVTGATGRAYAAERGLVYERLVQQLDARLSKAGELGMIFMDGDGSETSYYDAHRNLKLAHRHIIEDPLYQASHRNQWVQMADVTAWSAYQSLRQAPGRRFAWGWYSQHLLEVDVNGGPVAV